MALLPSNQKNVDTGEAIYSNGRPIPCQLDRFPSPNGRTDDPVCDVERLRGDDHRAELYRIFDYLSAVPSSHETKGKVVATGRTEFADEGETACEESERDEQPIVRNPTRQLRNKRHLSSHC
jgi:hypothetical protein